MKPDKKHECQQGFTLIELLTSILILTVGLLAMATMHVTAITVNTSARNVTESTMLAQSKIEELMNLPYDHDDLKEGNYDEDAENLPSRFDSLTWIVKDDVGKAGNMKKITITVTWYERDTKKTTQVICARSPEL